MFKSIFLQKSKKIFFFQISGLLIFNMVIIYILAIIGHIGLNGFSTEYGWYFSSIT